MVKRLGRFWILSLIPLIIGLILAYTLLSVESITIELPLPQSNPVMITIPFYNLPIWVGSFMSALILAWLFVRNRLMEGTEQQLVTLQETNTAERHRFLNRLDHELKNPLQAMQATIENTVAGPTTNADLAPIKKQIDRISRLVEDLRKVSKTESLELEFSSIDLNLLMRDIFAQIKEEHPHASQRRMKLMIPEAPRPLPHISGDPDLLFLAIYNLLDNAIKYSRKNSSVELRAREEGSYIHIEIADTGCGISEDDLPYIFDELYRGDRTEEISGSGIGLSLTRAIIQRHEGVVRTTSKLGEGSVFLVRLPITI